MMDGQTSIRQMAAALGADLFETGRIVFNLITVGVVSVEKVQKPKEESFDEVPILQPELSFEGPFQMNAEQWKLISQIDGRRTVGSLANLVGIPAPTLMAVLKKLAEKGFIRLSRGPAKAEISQKAASTKKEDDSSEKSVAAFRPRIRAIGIE